MLSSAIIVRNISAPLLHLDGPIYIGLLGAITASGHDHSVRQLLFVLLREVFNILNLILNTIVRKNPKTSGRLFFFRRNWIGTYFRQGLPRSRNQVTLPALIRIGSNRSIRP